jgi:hypothetical protein
MTEDELIRASLLEPGVYPFEVMTAVDKISKTGNEMIELKLNVFGDNQEAHVFDYLLEKMAFKLRHFAEATGLIADYEVGSLDALACLNKMAYAKIGVDKGNGSFPPKNVVLDYVKAEVAGAPTTKNSLLEALSPATPKPTSRLAPAAAGDKPFDDDVPF